MQLVYGLFQETLFPVSKDRRLIISNANNQMFNVT